MAMFECKTSARIWGGANMHVKCLCEVVISGSSVQLLQKASLATETTGG